MLAEQRNLSVSYQNQSTVVIAKAKERFAADSVKEVN